MSRSCTLRKTAVFAILFSFTEARAFDAFIPVGAMTNPRFGANAAVLPNGNVLVAGGRGLLGFTPAAEIFDASANVFGPAGSMVGTFAYRASAPLPDGDVLFVGGLASGDAFQLGTNHAEIFHVATAAFAATGDLVAYGTYPGTRWAATATPLNDGRVLVVGGMTSTGTLPDAQLYDPATGSFSLTGFMSTARALHTASRLPSGRVLIAGGTQLANASIHNQSAEIWDPATGTFATTGQMTSYIEGRYGATATSLNDGRVLIAGGEDGNGVGLSRAEIFDETSGTFVAVGDLATARTDNGAALLADGRVLIVGGADPAAPDITYATTELFDPATGQFSAAAAMSTARSDAAVIALHGGRVLCAGGADNDGAPMSSAEVYVANVIFAASFDSP